MALISRIVQASTAGLRLLIIGVLLICGAASRARAEDGDRELANRARGAAAMQLQLMASDLLDELVYGWTRESPLDGKFKLVIMGVNVPIGLNAQLASLLETHINELIIKNPETGLIPVYCGACTAVTTYAIRDKTVIARGADIPEVAATLKDKAAYALYLDFEGQGAQLVLRASIVRLEDHRLVYGKSLATGSSQPSSLRSAEHLVSAGEARREYISILEGRKRMNLSLGLRVNIIQAETNVVAATPFVWATVGMETYVNHRKKWLADFRLGVASLKGEHNAWQLSSRLYRHLWLDESDLSKPDVYFFAGPTYWEISGPGAVLFKERKKLQAGTIAARLAGKDYQSKAHNIGMVLGLETRIAEFMRMGAFIETFLNQSDNQNLKRNIQSYGLELGVIL